MWKLVELEAHLLRTMTPGGVEMWTGRVGCRYADLENVSTTVSTDMRTCALRFGPGR